MSDDAAAEARARLDLAGKSPLARPRDRWTHAVGTAALGPVFGLYTVVGSSAAITVAFFVVVGGVGWWFARLSTVPRHARTIGKTAMVASMVLSMVGLGVQNAGSEPSWLEIAVPVLVAVPLLVGGALIARGPR